MTIFFFPEYRNKIFAYAFSKYLRGAPVLSSVTIYVILNCEKQAINIIRSGLNESRGRLNFNELRASTAEGRSNPCIIIILI